MALGVRRYEANTAGRTAQGVGLGVLRIDGTKRAAYNRDIMRSKWWPLLTFAMLYAGCIGVLAHSVVQAIASH
jgi:hypothetical protein